MKLNILITFLCLSKWKLKILRIFMCMSLHCTGKKNFVNVCVCQISCVNCRLHTDLLALHCCGHQNQGNLWFSCDHKSNFTRILWGGVQGFFYVGTCTALAQYATRAWGLLVVSVQLHLAHPRHFCWN